MADVLASGLAKYGKDDTLQPITLTSLAVLYPSAKLEIAIAAITDQRASKANASGKLLWELVCTGGVKHRFDFGGADEGLAIREAFKDTLANFLGARAIAPAPAPATTATPSSAAEVAAASSSSSSLAVKKEPAAKRDPTPGRPPKPPAPEPVPTTTAPPPPGTVSHMNSFPGLALPTAPVASASSSAAAKPGSGGAATGASKIGRADLSRATAIKNLKKRKGTVVERAYQEMVVMNKTVGEEDFWNEHAAEVEAEISRAERQILGLPSALPKPESAFAAGDQRVQYTRSVMAAIFADHPSVKKAYNAMVPEKFSEHEFWTKVAQCQLLYNSGNIRDKESEAADRLFMPFIEAEHKTKEEVKWARIKTVGVDSDLSRAMESAPHGFGNREVEERTGEHKSLVGSHAQAQKRKTSQELMHKYNWHGMCVISPDLVGTEQEVVSKRRHVAAAVSEVETENLRGEPPARTIPLQIRNSAAFFQDSGQYRHQSGSVELFQQGLTAWSIAQPRVIPRSDVAVKALATFYQLCNHQDEGMRSLKATETPSIFIELSQNGFEKLRHFWKNFPPTDQEGAKKIDKIGAAIEALKRKIQTILMEEWTAEQRAMYTPRLEPLVDMLDLALDKWNDEKKAREVRKQRLLQEKMQQQQKMQANAGQKA